MSDIDSDPQAEVHRVEYDPEIDDSLCYTLVRSVGAITNDEPLAVEPLYNSVDPDALEAFVRSLRRSNEERGSVEFPLHGCHVMVQGNGTIEIRHRADEDSQSEGSTEST